MGNEYLPPGGTRLPFNFTDAGYEAPNSTSLLFNFAPKGNFGFLKAAITAMQPYWYETHTYPKSCPKYIVGYGSGGVQIIKGRCLFGGIRDLQGMITGNPKGFTEGSLTAYINAIYNTGTGNLPSYCLAVKPYDLTGSINTHLPEDLSAELNPEKFKGVDNLSAFVETHSPGDITAWIGMHSPDNLGGIVEGIKYKGSSNLGLILAGTHVPVDLGMTLDGTHFPENLRAAVRALQKDYEDLTALLTGLKKKSSALLQASVETHGPSNIGAAIRIWRSSSYDISASLKPWSAGDIGANIGAHPWQDLIAMISGSGKGVADLIATLVGEKFKGSYNLTSHISTHLPRDLGLSITGVKSDTETLIGILHGWKETYLTGLIGTHGPANIGAGIRGWFSDTQNLGAAIKSWRSSQKDLSGYIDTHLPVDLSSQIGTHLPENLSASAGAHKYGQLWLIIRSWHRNNQSDLSSYTVGWQQGNISAYLGGVPPRDLKVYLRAWRREVTADLSSTLSGWQQGPDIGAQIDTHFPRDIYSNIRAWQREHTRDLQATFWGWEYRHLSASLTTHPYEVILAFIRSWQRGIISNLGGQVKVWQESSLGAITDSHMWGTLGAKLLPHPPPPLPASIRGWAVGQQRDISASTYGWQASDLSAFTGAHPWATLNIILKGIVVEAEKDLGAYARGWQQGNLSAIIDKHTPRDLGMILKGVVLGASRNLPANFWGWEERSLGMTTKGGHLPLDLIGYINIFQTNYANMPGSVYGWQKAELGATVGGHLYGNIFATLRPWYRDQINNLTGFVSGWGQTDLNSIIGIHLPGDLRGIIKVAYYTSKLLPANIWGWEERFLGMTLAGTHDPVDLLAQIQVKQRESKLLNALIHAWHVRYLTASLNIMFPYDLNAVLQPILPSDLAAYLKVRPQEFLTASTYGWGQSDLGATIHQIYNRFLPAKIYGLNDTFKNLRALLKGVALTVPRDLSAFVRSLHFIDLSASLRATYLASISAYLYPIQPKDITAKIHAWHERFLQGILIGQDYPWNLTAEIYSTGEWTLLGASIWPKVNVLVQKYLSASCHPWEINHLTSNIIGENAVFLGGILIPVGYSSSLHASIRPKMIRLTTVINIPTMNHKDLSAIINYPCFKTGVMNLTSSIYSNLKGDLSAYLKVLNYNYKPALLGAKIGYTDSVSEVDKLKLRIIIYPSEIMSEDKLKLYVSVLMSGSLLNAYIKGTLQYRQLSASVVSKQPIKFTYESPVKNREMVIHKTYAGVLEKIEYVEFAFKSIVRDYYYSSDGDYTWKKDRFERWMLDVKSYLPTNTSLRLKRRLHRATTLYDLRRFASVDEALRYAIDFVTEYPQGNLSASIYNRGTYSVLSGTINPRYIIKGRTMLSSNIVAVGNTIVLSVGEDITKI